jgi:hypothetical protein
MRATSKDNITAKRGAWMHHPPRYSDKDKVHSNRASFKAHWTNANLRHGLAFFDTSRPKLRFGGETFKLYDFSSAPLSRPKS